MFTTPCIIRKNTQELRQKLEELGYLNCIIEDEEYLFTSHGIFDCIYSNTAYEDMVRNGLVDCGDDENLFIALAALRDDTNHNQWFTDGKEWIIYMDNTDKGGLSYFQYFAMPRDINLENFHKATPTEIIAHFKQKE